MTRFIRKIAEMYGPFKKEALTMFLMLLVMQGLSLVSPFLYGKIIDALVVRESFGAVMMFALLALCASVLYAAVDYAKGMFELKHFSFKVPQHIAGKTLEKIFSFSIGQHTNEHSGVKQSVITRGEHSLDALTNNFVYQGIPLALMTCITVGALVYLSATLGLIVFAAVSLHLIATFFMNRKMGSDLNKLQEKWTNLDKTQSEILRNIAITQVNAQEKRVSSEYDKKMKELAEFGVQLWQRYEKMIVIRDICAGVAMFAVIATGAYFVYRGAYTPGYFVVLFSWTRDIFMRLGYMGQLYRQYAQLVAAVEKYFVMMDVAPEVKVLANPVISEKLNGRIEFRSVSFSYPKRCYLEDDKEKEATNSKNHEAISDVSFVIEDGQKVAFVGHSGAGKSTIAQLIVRAYDPDKGQVVVDSNDLRVLDLKRYRESVGVVEQDVRLFDNTLRYNITFGLNGSAAAISDKELHAVMKAACIDKFYHRLEKGLDTLIGERGTKLSGGERQRVGVARALIKEPQILVFDEATSNLDAENEALIRRAIEKAARGKTTIIIAHRLSTIKNVDKIFVMEKGMLVGQGTHKELMESCEAYQRLISSQIASV